MRHYVRVSVLLAVSFLATGVLLAASAAQAAFHLYDITEVYSSADGSVQFVEMFSPFNNQHSLIGHTIVASQGASTATFTFPENGPMPTGNTFLLIATASFEAACGFTPDFILPDNFLFDPDGIVNFGPGTDIVNYASLPLDGVLSLNYPGGGTAPQSPENHAGQTCGQQPELVPALSPTAIALLVLGLGGAGAIRMRVSRGLTQWCHASRD